VHYHIVVQSSDSDVMDQLLIRYSSFIRYRREEMVIQWDSSSFTYSLQESR